MSAVHALLAEEKIDLHISASALRVLQNCGREWWYRYVEGAEPEDRPARLILGSAMHEALAMYYAALRDGLEEPGGDELLGVAHAALHRATQEGPPVLFAEDEGLGDLREEAERLLVAFRAGGLRPERVLAVELPFALPLVHPETDEVLGFEERLAGALDLVIEENGAIVVVDHKTAARSDKEKGARPDDQMSIYAMAAREVFGAERVELRYQNLIKTRLAKVEIQPIERAEHDEADAVEAVAGALELVHVALGHPRGKRLMGRRRSWRCRECSFRRRCAGDRT